MQTLYCVRCAKPTTVVSGMKLICSNCQNESFTTDPQPGDKPGIEWTENDKRFLRSIRIEAT